MTIIYIINFTSKSEIRMEAAHEDGETVIPFPPLYENITYDVISPHVPSIHQLNDECLDILI